MQAGFAASQQSREGYLCPALGLGCGARFHNAVAMRAYCFERFTIPLPPGHRFPVSKSAMLRDQVGASCPDVQLIDSPPRAMANSRWRTAPATCTTRRRAAVRCRDARDRPAVVAGADRTGTALGWRHRVCRARGLARRRGRATGGRHAPRARRPWRGFLCVQRHRRGRASDASRVAPPPAPLLRVLVVDLDVHQGDGTATIFADDPTVFTLSLHGARNFPVRKACSDLDVELPDGCDDAAYLEALDRALDTSWQRLRRCTGRPGVLPGGCRSA